MGSLHFGSGALLLGTEQVGELKDVSIDVALSTKTYKGRKQVTKVTIVTEKKITGKATSGYIDGALLAKVMGGTVDAGPGPFTITDPAISTSKKATIANADMAKATTYALVLSNQDADGNDFAIKLLAVVITKGSLGLKAEDFADGNSVEFEAQEDATGNVGEIFYE